MRGAFPLEYSVTPANLVASLRSHKPYLLASDLKLSLSNGFPPDIDAGRARSPFRRGAFPNHRSGMSAEPERSGYAAEIICRCGEIKAASFEYLADIACLTLTDLH